MVMGAELDLGMLWVNYYLVKNEKKMAIELI